MVVPRALLLNEELIMKTDWASGCPRREAKDDTWFGPHVEAFVAGIDGDTMRPIFLVSRAND